LFDQAGTNLAALKIATTQGCWYRLKMKQLTIFFFIALTLSCTPEQVAKHAKANKGAAEPRQTERGWHLFGKNGINIQPAWAITHGAQKVTIAVLDGGFLPRHPAFSQGQCHAEIMLEDFVNGEKWGGTHGTGVSSVIGTCANNPLSLIGINDHSPMYWIELGDGWGDDAALIRWLNGNPEACNSHWIHCDHPNTRTIDVVNLSFGRMRDEFDSRFARAKDLPAIEEGNAKGIIFVAGAGNNSLNADNAFFPAAATGVISVGATTIEGVAAGFSNWGESVTVMAPGQHIPVASASSFVFEDGTSLATPMVTGTISLMKSVYPELNWKTAIYLLQTTSRPMSCQAYCSDNYAPAAKAKCQRDCCQGTKQVCTPGLLDAGAAVAAAQKASAQGLPPVALVDSDKYLIELDPGAQASFTLFNVGGAEGTYKLTTPHAFFVLDKDEVTLAPRGQPGDHATLHVRNNPHGPPNWDMPIHIKSPESGILSGFSDEMTIYVHLGKWIR
jgi:hypothetical protein